ncbi:5'-methylthioadenosine/S-adenosylhomocysteine nucleosidase [Burkholderia sp. Ac-20365]|uniref:5'-methylthioadenosine/S-adenosylhomocysteine nucleosidase family protein n=1 Tax=Burkholderia sp. Ac-20365 TaxID=2703897 RepID=UPI00197B3E64|nr:5'-methylthioadenosine/S-adenosylhomocysteine nucleosidase [Burkholderia sp. Ac-20365]MBN3760769.1 5'-methylthioadenosine/S-adenosylhomocysteine nucleosidase [Burkholderia sp. Ac-20365]
MNYRRSFQYLLHSIPQVSQIFESQNSYFYAALAAHCSQMGPVTAALTTQALVYEFRPRVVVMTGICGGIDSKIQLGDLIIADRSWDWQSGKWNADGEFEAAPDQFSATPGLLQAAQAESASLPELRSLFRGPAPKEVNLIPGPMVSGSAVVARASMHEMFKRQHRKALAVDMECFGVYSACNSVTSAKPAVVCLKSVSDLANRDKGDDYQPFGSYISAKFAERMLDRFFQDLKY